MKKFSLDHFILRTGNIINSNHIAILLADEALAEQDVCHSGLVFWQKDKNWSNEVFDFNGISLASKPHVDENQHQLIMLGEDGELVEVIQGSLSENTIPNGEGMASIRYINHQFIAVGIRGMIFDVTDIHNPINLSDASTKENIESCCASSTNHFFVCGWRGFIAEYQSNGQLKKFESGTNVILTDIICDDNDHIYACGQRGTIVYGKKEALTPLVFEGVNVDFWSIREFQGNIYVASITALYQLIDHETLELVNFEDDAPISCYHLDTYNNSLMLSIGQKDAMLFDGKQWSRLL